MGVRSILCHDNFCPVPFPTSLSDLHRWLGFDLCSPRPPEGPETTENSSRSKVGLKIGLGGSVKVGHIEKQWICVLLTYFWPPFSRNLLSDLL